MHNQYITRFLVVSTLLLSACAAKPELKTVEHVDIDKFMGEWFVIANIPTPFERGAHNAVEHYRKNEKGEIETIFSFRKNSFDGELKRFKPKGFVKDTNTNAIWKMQFIWPIKSDYRIAYLSEDYEQVIIARQARDYVWIMARTPSISETDYQRLRAKIAQMDYDIIKLVKVPQLWNENAG